MQNSEAGKSRPVPKPRTRLSQSIQEPQIEDEQKLGTASCMKQLDGNCETHDSNTLYDSKRVLVTGLSENSTNDALSNYMELMTGEDVEKVTFLGQGRAVVDTSGPPDFEKLVKKVNTRNLDGMQLSVEQIKACDSIIVSGLSAQVTKDTITLYFENVRRSDGGDVKDVVFHKDTNSAVVYFEDGRVVDNVISKEHTLEGQQLSVEKYYPQLSSENAASPTSEAMASSKDLPDAEQSKKQERRDVSPEYYPQTSSNLQSMPIISLTDISPSFDETRQSTRPVIQEQEIPDNTMDREMASVDVDADIMQFIMDGAYAVELQRMLEEQLKAEIEWEPGNETVTIVKKAKSGYIKKWKEKCRDAVSTFLDKFENISIQLSSVAGASVINDALPRLEERLPKKKALCKVDEDKENVIIVCHESDQDNVKTIVENFLEIVEKEEVRKTYKEDEIEINSKKRMEFLRHIRFVEETKRKSGELEVDVDYERQKMRLVGPHDQIKSFKMEYFRLMEEITEHSFVLPSNAASSIVSNRDDYFQQKLAMDNITAMFFSEEGNVIRIVAKSFSDWQEAQKCLLGSIKQERVTLGNENAFIFKSEKCMGFVKELEKRQLVNIDIDKSGSCVFLSGVIEDVVSAKKEIDDLVEMERIRSKNFKIPEGHASFLQRFRAKDLKDIEEVMKMHHVSIHIHQDSVEIKGTHEGLLKSVKPFCELRDTIVAQKKTFSKPGLSELIRGENGQRNLKMIAEERESVIELCKDGNHGVPKDEIQDSTSSSDEKAPMEVVAPSRVVAPNRSRHPDYDICQFTTMEGLNVSWNYGNLELVTADVLVNSANSNLKNPSACGHALIQVGGKQFIEACQKFTNINSGDIVCTSGGNLSCKHVIHAVCGDWDGEGGNGEKKLRGLVQKILSKSVELCASSLAMPIIGTGGHQFPEKIVIRVYREEIEKFSKGHPSQLCLKSIGIVVFKKPSETSASLPLPVKSSASLPDGSGAVHVPRQSTGTIYDGLCDFTTKEGTKVTWKYGNIEKESADVLVSSATSDLNSPTVCGKALNAVGGQSFVQACQPYNKIGEGNIACTAGGNLSCKNVLHAVCCDWKKKGSKKVLQGLVQKILSNCTVLGASSLALPIIGTGQHKFPEKDVLRIYREEIEKFSAATSSQCSLKDISIVVFSAKRPATPLPSQPIPNQPSASRPPAGLSRVVSFGQVRVSLHEGDITQQPTQSDALINILSPDLQLASGGGVCASILQSGGRQIQNELNQAAGAIPGSVVTTSAGSIGGVKRIIHAIPTTNDVPGLQSSMAQCLNSAKTESLSSVSIPAVGTASFHVSAKDSAELILKAAKDFSSVNHPLAVNIVVFQKNMVPDFEAKIHESVTRNAANLPNAAQPPVQLSATSPNLPSQTTTLTPAPSIVNVSASTIPRPQPVDYKSLKFEVAMEVIQLTFTAGSQRVVEESIREVQKFIDDQIAVKTIELQNVCDVLSKNWQEIEKLARKHKVNITCMSPSKVEFEGLLLKASECKEKLQGLVLKDVVEEQRMNEQKNEQNLVEYFSKTVQWSQLQGTQSVDYGKDANAAIEKAFINEDRQIAITAQMFDVDFKAMTLKNQNNGQVTTIARKRIGENSTNNSDIPLPTNWSPQPQGKLVQLVLLPTSSPEYQNVQRRFSSTAGARQVISIERIQNPTLYKAYAAMKQIMPRPNEMQLFHGTRANNTAAINQNGFNRIFAGANGVALGNGIYFAKDASTSLGYSQRGGNSLGQFKMYLAQVLAGDYAVGSNGIKTPPKKNDPNNPELLYDSTVNSVQNPGVVVTFLDPQCYPEYLITFR